MLLAHFVNKTYTSYKTRIAIIFSLKCYPSIFKVLILYTFRQNKISPDIKKSDSVPVTFFDARTFYVIFIPGSIKIGQDPYFGEHRSCPFPCWQAYAHRKRQGL